MNHLLHITHNGDLYEVSILGYKITRISRYVDGSSVRTDVTYDELPKVLQEKVVERIVEAIKKYL